MPFPSESACRKISPTFWALVSYSSLALLARSMARTEEASTADSTKIAITTCMMPQGQLMRMKINTTFVQGSCRPATSASVVQSSKVTHWNNENMELVTDPKY